MPTLEHFPDYKKDGGKATVDNAVLAHRLCNRLDHSLRAGRSHEKDLERIRKAREKAIRRNNVQIRNARDFHSGAFFVFFGFGVAASASGSVSSTGSPVASTMATTVGISPPSVFPVRTLLRRIPSSRAFLILSRSLSCKRPTLKEWSRRLQRRCARMACPRPPCRHLSCRPGSARGWASSRSSSRPSRW